MEIKKKSISIIPVFVLFLYISGCRNDSGNTINPSQTEITVSGKVTNLVNQAVPNATVQIGDQSTVSSAEGAFSLGNVKSPYNVIVTDNTNQETKYFYGITAEQVNIPGVGTLNPAVSCNITVNFPAEILQPGVRGKMIFTDNNYVNSYSLLAQGIPLNVWLPDNNPVTGKVILITYIKDASGNIISYENFGVSAPIQVVNGGQYSYNFTLDEVSFNPDEETVSGIINNQPGFNATPVNYFLTFSGKRTPNYSTQQAFQDITGNNFNVVVPKNLPVSVSNMIFNYSNNGQTNNIELFKLPSSATGISLDTKSAPELLTPEENATNVTGSTPFTFTTGSGLGIYQVNLIDQTNSKNYIIYLSGNSFTLNDFSELFPNGISSSSLKWSVEKVGFSNSINEYVTTYSDKPEYFRTNTVERNFSTAE